MHKHVLFMISICCKFVPNEMRWGLRKSHNIYVRAVLVSVLSKFIYSLDVHQANDAQMKSIDLFGSFENDK